MRRRHHTLGFVVVERKMGYSHLLLYVLGLVVDHSMKVDRGIAGQNGRALGSDQQCATFQQQPCCYSNGTLAELLDSMQEQDCAVA